MRILISVDMEGISGVSRWEHVQSAQPEYAIYRRIMTEDVNAAVRGAFAGGADEVIVHDGHGKGQNILIEELDPRAELSRGTCSPLCMTTGIQTGVDAVFTVGYHAKAGSAPAILAHSMGSHILSYKVNGQEVGEFGLSGMLAGRFGAPIIFASGDQALAEEAKELYPGINVTIVKLATGYIGLTILVQHRPVFLWCLWCCCAHSEVLKMATSVLSSLCKGVAQSFSSDCNQRLPLRRFRALKSW